MAAPLDTQAEDDEAPAEAAAASGSDDTSFSTDGVPEAPVTAAEPQSNGTAGGLRGVRQHLWPESDLVSACLHHSRSLAPWFC